MHAQAPHVPALVLTAFALASAACEALEHDAPPNVHPTNAHSNGARAETEPSDDDPPEAARKAAVVDPAKRVVYVPAYSHIGVGKGDRTMLGVTLSVRNVDHAATVTLTAVDYFDTTGSQVRRYLDKPMHLKPLATAEFFVEVLDDTGGSGANFLVQWSGPEDCHPLLTETVMVGHGGQGYLSFTSRGVELDAPPPTTPPPAAAVPSPAVPEPSSGP